MSTSQSVEEGMDRWMVRGGGGERWMVRGGGWGGGCEGRMGRWM